MSTVTNLRCWRSEESYQGGKEEHVPRGRRRYPRSLEGLYPLDNNFDENLEKLDLVILYHYRHGRNCRQSSWINRRMTTSVL
jgi:hypothetical protein